MGDLVVTSLNKRVFRDSGSLLPSRYKTWTLDLVLIEYLIRRGDSLGVTRVHEGVLKLIGEGTSL